MSTHNPVMAKRAVESGIVEMLMFSINPVFDLLPLLPYPARCGVGDGGIRYPGAYGVGCGL